MRKSWLKWLQVAVVQRRLWPAVPWYLCQIHDRVLEISRGCRRQCAVVGSSAQLISELLLYAEVAQSKGQKDAANMHKEQIAENTAVAAALHGNLCGNHTPLQNKGTDHITQIGHDDILRDVGD